LWQIISIKRSFSTTDALFPFSIVTDDNFTS
jgi:hypothetical protein